jgi:hypothetical protein
MKTIKIIIAFVLLFSQYGKCKPLGGEDSLHCLEISGKIGFNGACSDNLLKIELIQDNRVVDSMTIKGKRTFKFNLKKNGYYGIRISKKGFVPRLISVCTDLEGGDISNKIYRFRFDTKLISVEGADELNKDALDFPIAVISFDRKKGWFYYSKKYTSQIKRKIYNQDVSEKV